jgi:hypothetical protein
MLEMYGADRAFIQDPPGAILLYRSYTTNGEGTVPQHSGDTPGLCGSKKCALKAQTFEIWETDEERALSVGQLKYKCLRAAKQDFQGKVFINNETKKQIRVSQDGLMEWWKKSR